MKTEIDTNFSFDLPKNRSNVMKVMGIGGGGSNAVNYMYKQGIKGVDFVVCNTDSQALEESPVPNKIKCFRWLHWQWCSQWIIRKL